MFFTQAMSIALSFLCDGIGTFDMQCITVCVLFFPDSVDFSFEDALPHGKS